METDRKWIVVRIDGKIAAVSTDYRMLARISGLLAGAGGSQSGKRYGQESCYGEKTAKAVSFDEVWKLRRTVRWDDLLLFGTEFQKKVWRKLWELTHPSLPQGDTSGQNEEETSEGQSGDGPSEGQTDRSCTRLICYSDFAELCQNRAGVRAVAHAIGLNPVSVIVPCHLVIPKEGIDKISDIQKKAETTIFKGDDLCLSSILQDPSIDFGEYALGKALKRELINLELTGNVS